MTKIEDNSGTLTIILDTGAFHHSEFPHQLVTLDYDESDNLIQIVAAGRMTHLILSGFALWRERGDDVASLITAIRNYGMADGGAFL